MSHRIGRILISGLLMLAPTAFASTLYVGTCHTPSYNTISAAVAAATAGATIDVCPGTYAEQVFITQELTLQGITSAGGDRARIVVPANAFGGPTSWQFVTDPLISVQVAPQIFVNSPAGAPVKITNLTIDGSGEVGAPMCGSSGSWYTTGIYAWTSVTIDEVNTVGQGQTSCGVGIWDEQGLPAVVPSFVIEHSSVQNPSLEGIALRTPSPPVTPMTVSVTSNTVEMNPASSTDTFALFVGGATGKISSNTFVSQVVGIEDNGGNSSLTISNNTLVFVAAPSGPPCCPTGVDAYQVSSTPDSVTYSGNNVVGFYVGMGFAGNAGPVTVKNNTIVNSNSAFDLGCAETLSGNTINNAKYGFLSAPTGFSTTGRASLYNVDQFILSSISCP